LSGRITRRQVAAAMLASAAAAQAPPPIPHSPEEELAEAREQVLRIADTLAGYPLPMATEPACHFKA
jgi:hypothetical protein